MFNKKVKSFTKIASKVVVIFKKIIEVAISLIRNFSITNIKIGSLNIKISKHGRGTILFMIGTCFVFFLIFGFILQRCLVVE